MSCEKKLASPLTLGPTAVSRTRLKVTEGNAMLASPVNLITTSSTDALLGTNPGSPKLGPTSCELSSVKLTPGLKVKPVGKGPVVFSAPKSLMLKDVGCAESMVQLLK